MKAWIKDLLEKFSHETKRILAHKFLIVFLILLSYFGFTVHRFGLKDGFFTMALTWSFFVLSTPIADAGIILDLPLRLFFGIKMVYSEIVVWTIAISLNALMIIANQAIYSKTVILIIFKEILTNPFPYWLIILFSGMGTFLSVYFGDELMDVVFHKHRKKYNMHKEKYIMIMTLSIFIFVIVIYDILLRRLNLSIF